MPTKPRFFGWFSAKTPLGVKEWTRHSAALASFFARARGENGRAGGSPGASAGGLLSGGLGELLERFNQSGHGETAQSWGGTGPNQPVTPPQLEQAIGPEVLETLSKQTGLSRQELLAR